AYSYDSVYSASNPISDTRMATSVGRPWASRDSTSARCTPAHSGYESKSMIAASTSGGGAAISMVPSARSDMPAVQGSIRSGADRHVRPRRRDPVRLRPHAGRLRAYRGGAARGVPADQRPPGGGRVHGG